ncbi:MFS transporter [Methylovirgula sp. 4M-Z18]|uniref:MFS transporter n=1 Tax=Methylovirgula sp. 4M-Z18 TaxID=2293567 RepID=UPI000E2ECAE0|nr:MFS transporter [Methylovirgula sp. 4M-Z18]RFB80830.1 MFS transporter [Methylovirgula sp. 4M-Z18]
MGNLNTEQKKIVFASFLGWALDAFDFFLLTFVLKDVAATFGVEIHDVAYALFLTLATRFVGAFIFGRLGDRFGRKPILMLDILCYSILGAAAAFAPSLTVFLVLRALFGVAMGGEWGLGSSLAMESISPQSRGLVSGILQCGYPAGFLLASIVYGLFYNTSLFGYVIDWRGLFLFSIIPALLVLFIRQHVPESPAFIEAQKTEKPPFLATLASHWQLVLYATILMMAFNMFSHGSQDLYATFLQKQHDFDQHTVSILTIVANLGAITGGLVFGALSERIGRANAITLAALIALPAIPLWAYGSTPVLLAIGAFVMQISVQGAWGVIPAHLNELFPSAVRATLPGFIYQLGNFLASYNGPYQAKLAEQTSFSYALAVVIGIVAIVVAVFIRFTPERRGEVITAVT